MYKDDFECEEGRQLILIDVVGDGPIQQPAKLPESGEFMLRMDYLFKLQHFIQGVR